MNFPSFLAATSFLSNGSGDVVLGILVLLVALAVIVLDYIAIFKIITKAGYSGWWIILEPTDRVRNILWGHLRPGKRLQRLWRLGDVLEADRRLVDLCRNHSSDSVGVLLCLRLFRLAGSSTTSSRHTGFPACSVSGGIREDVQDLGIARAEPMPVPHDPAPEGPGLRCSRCGATVTGGTRFCESCGQPTFSMPAVPSDPPSVAAASIPNADRTPEAVAPRFWEDHPGAVTVPPNEHDTADADPSPKEVGGPEPVEAAPHCRMCTHPIEVGSRFCGRCGAAIAAT